VTTYARGRLQKRVIWSVSIRIGDLALVAIALILLWAKIRGWG
jgi:hypothetical protein